MMLPLPQVIYVTAIAASMCRYMHDAVIQCHSQSESSPELAHLALYIRTYFVIDF